MVIPNKQINLLYTLFATYRALGATIGFPDLYLVFCWLGMLNSFAALITNLAGRPTCSARPDVRASAEVPAEQQQARHAEPA